MSTARSLLLSSVAVLVSCSNNMGQPMSGEADAAMGEGGTGVQQQPGTFTPGKDYVVLKRVRFLDEMGFDRPVEAFSMLFPTDWKTEGGVRWKGVGECRGEIVSMPVKATSPDGKIQFESTAPRAFNWADDQMMAQALMAGAQAGGCGVNQPFTAEQYIQGYAQQDLGATASEIMSDDRRMTRAREMDEQANAIATQYGNNSEQSTTYAKGMLTWPDGTHGIMEAGVTNSITRKPDMYTGGVSTFSSTMVFYVTITRFVPERKEEAERMLALFTSSHRMNPVWQQAKENYLTQLGNIEHAGRMEKIRLMGEQAQAYANAQGDASDRQMRNWEQQQASQDNQHTQFVKTIREVETWNDGSNGRVELTSGYDHAWSRGDGSYILSNSPNFDPSSVLKDQAWKPMQQVP
ncbi:MAG: hypothetical protein IPP26_09265 [Flavobacteriales bacterium]|nr:hypothetical protein [Flavobacteriales bacterium]